MSKASEEMCLAIWGCDGFLCLIASSPGSVTHSAAMLTSANEGSNLRSIGSVFAPPFFIRVRKRVETPLIR